MKLLELLVSLAALGSQRSRAFDRAGVGRGTLLGRGISRKAERIIRNPNEARASLCLSKARRPNCQLPCLNV